MNYTQEVENMCIVKKGPNHGPAPIPEEGKWVKAYEIKDISGFTHGVGWCAPQQGACKLSLNIKDGIIEEALVETIGCSGMTHSAAMASEILPGKTILEALNTDLVCDAINTAMRELFLQIVYGRSQSAFSDDGLNVGAGLEDLGKGLRSQVGTMYGTRYKGVRYLEMAEGYVTRMALDEDDQVIGYEFVSLGKMTDFIKKGDDAQTAYDKSVGTYGRFAEAVEDNSQGLCPDLVCVEGYFDSALSGSEALVTCEEAEALCLLGEEHLAEVAVTEADLAVFGDGAGDAERLETDADCGSGVGSLDSAALYSDSAADCVCPDSVFKADGLGTSDDLVAVDALCKSDLFALLDGGNAVLSENGVDLVNSSLIVFK